LAGRENVPLLRMFGPATFGCAAAAFNCEAAALPAKGTHKLAAHVSAGARYFIFIVCLPFSNRLHTSEPL
jgi:hypothetical protein